MQRVVLTSKLILTSKLTGNERGVVRMGPLDRIGAGGEGTLASPGDGDGAKMTEASGDGVDLDYSC